MKLSSGQTLLIQVVRLAQIYLCINPETSDSDVILALFTTSQDPQDLIDKCDRYYRETKNKRYLAILAEREMAAGSELLQ